MVTLASSLPLRLGELPFKGKQSPDDSYREFAQRWKDMLAFEGHSLAEKYANGRVALVCDLHASFLCRVKHPRASVGNDPFRDREFFASLVYVADIANPLELQFGDDKPMFVHNVETVELPDGVTIPSLVGLYRIHDVVDDPFGGLTFQSSLDGDFKLIPSLTRREDYLIRPLASSGEFNITHRNVESTSQVMDGIAHDTHKFWGDGLTRDEFERIVASIRLTMHANTVSVIADELTKFGLEILDVLSGPFDL